jgi:nucleotide-binding universal stress UspA family protein
MSVAVVVEAGEPARRLCALAEREQALLVIGAPADAAANGRDSAVASTILRDSQRPLLLVPGTVTTAVRAAPTASGKLAA